MIELFMSMAESGSISQSAAAGIHIFDLFDNSDMRQKGAKQKFSSSDDCNETFSGQLQSFDDAFGFNKNDDTDPDSFSEESLEVENLDGGLELKITINDRFGSKDFLANLAIDSDSNDLMMNITTPIHPYDSVRLARQMFRMNHQLQRKALQEKFHISAKKGPNHFQSLVKKSDHDDGDHDSGHYFQDLVSSDSDHGGGDHSDDDHSGGDHSGGR